MWPTEREREFDAACASGWVRRASAIEIETNSSDQSSVKEPSQALALHNRTLATAITIAIGQNSVMAAHSTWFVPWETSAMRCASAPAKFSEKKRWEWRCRYSNKARATYC